MKASRYKAASKDEKCQRCLERLPQYEARWHDESGEAKKEKVCLPCYQLMTTEEERKPGRHSELCVLDYAQSETTKLVKKWVEEKLGKLQFRLNDYPTTFYLCLKTSRLHAGDICVKRRVPKRPKGTPIHKWKQWLEGRVLVREALVYPHTKKVATATCQVKDKVSLALGCDKWWYEYEEVVFKDQAEAFVFGVGLVGFKLLRIMKAVEGLATKVGCSKAACLWLKEFRIWRAKQKPKTEKPLAFVSA